MRAIGRPTLLALAVTPLLAGLLGGPAGAQDMTPPGTPLAKPEESPFRYSIISDGKGVIRLDRQTGAMSLCRDGPGGLVCRLGTDEREAYERMLDELEGRVKALEDRLDAIERPALAPPEPAIPDPAPSEPGLPDDRTLQPPEEAAARGWREALGRALDDAATAVGKAMDGWWGQSGGAR